MARGCVFTLKEQTMRSWRSIDSMPTSFEIQNIRRPRVLPKVLCLFSWFQDDSKIFFVLEYAAHVEVYEARTFRRAPFCHRECSKKILTLGFLDFDFVLIFIWFHYVVILARALALPREEGDPLFKKSKTSVLMDGRVGGFISESIQGVGGIMESGSGYLLVVYKSIRKADGLFGI